MENPSSSPRPLKKKTKKKKGDTNMAGFASINEDLLHNILKRLPATSFSSASCVSKTWSRVCNRILSRPKLSSALSLNPSYQVYVVEAVNMVLSEPIRPHFVIANVIGDASAMKNTLLCLAEKLGWRIPIVVSCHSGIMGRDAVTSEFKEVVNTYDEDGDANDDLNDGISLTVGFMPGVKVTALPLNCAESESQDNAVDDFVTKIREFSASVSGSISPMAIIMFGNADIDLKPIMERLDYAMSKETVIVGDERARFVYRTGTERRNFCANRVYSSDAVAFVFARDRWRSPGIGEIQFSAALSSGVSSLGPVYKAASVRVNGECSQTWLTARREGQLENLDGHRILSNIHDELENHNYCPDLYIGVTKRRKCSIGSDKSRLMTFLSFHGVIGGDQDYLFVQGPGIRTGDIFQFHCPDSDTALSSCSNMSSKFRKLKLDLNSELSLLGSSTAANVGKKECIGGFIFSCSGRTEPFLGRSNADSSMFLENFPGVPLAGVFCGGEIGRGISILDENEGQEESKTNCCLHVYSCVYLLVSYTPAPAEH